MRIMLLSVTAGQGHNRTAQALLKGLEERGHTCLLVDALKYASPAMGELVDEGYRWSVAYTPQAFGKAYRAFEKAEHQEYEAMLKFYKRGAGLMCRELTEVYQTFAPDVVVSTNSIAAQIDTAVSRKGSAKPCRRVGIVTDYALHPFWIGTDLDLLITPSEQLDEGIALKGIDRRILRGVGIPIAEVFTRPSDPARAKAALELPPQPAILLMGGSMGHGNMLKAVKDLDQLSMDVQLLAVCGSNQRLKAHLEKLETQKPLRVYGYTDQIDVMMSACDLLVTKPGGLTVSEALAKQLPLVLMNPIPGQEDRNLDFLTNHGMAMRASATQPLREVVWQLLHNPARRELMRTAQQTFGKPNATADVCTLIEALTE